MTSMTDVVLGSRSDWLIEEVVKWKCLPEIMEKVMIAGLGATNDVSGLRIEISAGSSGDFNDVV